MKLTLEFEINKINLTNFFPEHRIKDKIELIEVMLEATRTMIFSTLSSSGKVHSKNKFILKIDRMNRLFFITDEKYYSIVFPFKVKLENEKLSFFYDEVNIDSQVISNIMEILKSDSFSSDCCCEFVDPIIDFQTDLFEFWKIIKGLLMIEDGYIRFDHDNINYQKFKNKGEEHKHPLNHCDIFMSNSGTFKIGVQKKIMYKEFINLLDSNENCMYLQ